MSIKGTYFERILLLHFFDIGKQKPKLIDLPFIAKAERPKWFDDYNDLLFIVDKFEDYYSTIKADKAYFQHPTANLLISPSNFAGPDGILFLEQDEKKLLILFGMKYTSNSITNSVSSKNDFATNIDCPNIDILRILLEFEDKNINSSTCQSDDHLFTITLATNDILNLFNITNNAADKSFASNVKRIMDPENPENFPKPSKKIEPKYPKRRKSARLQEKMERERKKGRYLITPSL